MSQEYFARYESPNIVIVPTEILTPTKIINDINTANATLNTESSITKEIDLKQNKVLAITQGNDSIVNNDRNVPICVRNIGSVDALEHFSNLQNIPVKISTQKEVITSIPKHSFHQNLVDLTNSNKSSAGALKRYLDYQRFLDKYYNNTCDKKKYKEKKVKSCSNIMDLKTTNKKCVKSKDNRKDPNIKADMEKSKGDTSAKSKRDRTPKKEAPKRKHYSNEDKKGSSDQSTDNKVQKKRREDYNEKSTTIKCVNKKEELKIKLTSYEKMKKQHTTHLNKTENKRESDTKLNQCSDRDKIKKILNEKTIDSSKHKLQRESQKAKEENNSKVKNKESGVKRKNTDPDDGEIKKIHKRKSSSITTSCQSKPDNETRIPSSRTVDVVKETSCHNYQDNHLDKNDLRSKLSRKRTKSQSNTEYTGSKATPTRENLVVTLKQDVQAMSSPSKDVQAITKPKTKKSKEDVHDSTKSKAKKSKKIKLVINIMCPNSDESDDNPNIDEPNESSTSPHQDLSFLDDFDVDGIVDSLNADHSPIRENIDVEEYVNDCNVSDNSLNMSPEPLKKNCQLSTQHTNLPVQTGESKRRFTNNANNTVLIETPTKTNVVEESNDDVYEVIDITDDAENNIILLEEDAKESSSNIIEDVPIICINEDSRDDDELNGDNKPVLVLENTEIIPKSVNEQNKLNVTNLTQVESPEVKYFVKQTSTLNASTNSDDAVETKCIIQKLSFIENSSINIEPNKNQIKSEHLKESQTFIKSEPISTIIKSKDAWKSQTVSSTISNVGENNMNSLDTSLKNIKKEMTDANINITKTIKSEHSSIPVQPNLVKNEGGIPSNETTVENIKIIKSEIPNSVSSKHGENSNKHSADFFRAKVIKSEDLPESNKCEAKSTYEVNRNKIIISNSSNKNTNSKLIESINSPTPEQPNGDLNDVDDTSANDKNVTIMKSEENSVTNKHMGSSKKRTADISTIKAMKSKDSLESDKFEARNTCKQAKRDKNVISNSNNDKIKSKSIDMSIHNTKTIKSKNFCTPVNRNVNLKDDVSHVTTPENVKIINTNGTCEVNANKNSAVSTQAKIMKSKDTSESIRIEATHTKVHDDLVISKSKNEKNVSVNKHPNIKMFMNDKLQRNIAKVLKKKIPKKQLNLTEVDKPTTTASEGKDGKQSIKDYWNAIEQRMFEYVHKKLTVTAIIYSGYFSSIYKCKDDKGEEYAIKMMKSRFQSMAIYKDKMLTSLQKNANKDRYFLLEMMHSFNIHGEWCFLSEYYPQTLAQVLNSTKKDKKCLHIDMVQVLSRQLVEAVSTLTQNQLIHADIKPSHILLNSSHNRLKLCGFDRMDYNYNIRIIPSTGTSSYRAPEIILGFNADYKIDVWSTALVMYEMATGGPLFPGRFNNDILFKQQCTIGPLPPDMIEASALGFMHFYGTKFMRQIGPTDWIFVGRPAKNNRLRHCPLLRYNETWAPTRSQLQIIEDEDKIEMLLKLLEQMLVMDPRQRLPITYVAGNEFIFHSDI